MFQTKFQHRTGLIRSIFIFADLRLLALERLRQCVVSCHEQVTDGRT